MSEEIGEGVCVAVVVSMEGRGGGVVMSVMAVYPRVVLWVPCGLPAGGLWVHMPPAVTRVGAASNTPGRFNLSTLKYREQSLQGTPLRSNHHYYHYNHLAMLARLEG